ncbi:MAG: hypothetical protein GX575_23450 [Candidatus Anammoximicrobium sp.]|nr:hypothetical protein [Candidatus Anammoximicrobium sp.]
MKDVDVLPAPELSLPVVDQDKWERERAAFVEMRPELLKGYRDQFVAIHEGEVVASGTDKITVALRAYGEHGRIPIYVGLVSESAPPPARLPSPRQPLNPRPR